MSNNPTRYIKSIAHQPVDPGIHGQIVDSMSATTDKRGNAPSIRMAMSNGLPAGAIVEYTGNEVPDGYRRRDDIPTLSELNDNLTIKEYTSSAQTLALAIDDYIDNSDLANNKSCMIKLITNLGNYQVEIFRAGTYSGFIQRLSSTEYGERYTFVKAGGASTVISPFNSAKEVRTYKIITTDTSGSNATMQITRVDENNVTSIINVKFNSSGYDDGYIRLLYDGGWKFYVYSYWMDGDTERFTTYFAKQWAYNVNASMSFIISAKHYV